MNYFYRITSIFLACMSSFCINAKTDLQELGDTLLARISNKAKESVIQDILFNDKEGSTKNASSTFKNELKMSIESNAASPREVYDILTETSLPNDVKQRLQGMHSKIESALNFEVVAENPVALKNIDNEKTNNPEQKVDKSKQETQEPSIEITKPITIVPVAKESTQEQEAPKTAISAPAATGAQPAGTSAQPKPLADIKKEEPMEKTPAEAAKKTEEAPKPAINAPAPTDAQSAGTNALPKPLADIKKEEPAQKTSTPQVAAPANSTAKPEEKAEEIAPEEEEEEA